MNISLKPLLFLLVIFSPSFLNAQIITTIAGSGSFPYSGDGGPATAAGCMPFDLRVDATGNMIFSDRLNERVRIVNTSGIINTYAGRGSAGYSGDGGPATNAYINVPNGVTIDVAGNYYIADGPNNRIRMVSPAGIITTYAGSGSGGAGGDGGPATNAQVLDPYGVQVDYSNNFYIADSYNNRIRKINRSTGIITTIAGNGTVGFSGDGFAATNAQLSWPTGLAFDHSGNMYICDFGNNRIRKVNAAGIITTIAGSGATGTTPGGCTGSHTGDGGPATAATLNSPIYLVFDNCGDLYFTDYCNNCIRMINTSGIISTVAGTGTAGFSGDGGPATAATMRTPIGIAFDNSGNLIVADEGNNRVRKITIAPGTSTSHTTDTSVCPGTPVTLYSDTGGTHLWSNGSTTPSIVATDSGTYWVSVFSSGCTGRQMDTTHIRYSNLISLNLGNDTSFCAGDSIILSPNLPDDILHWSTGSSSPSITVDSTGTYWVQTSDSDCVASDTIHITVNPRPVVNLGPDQSVCSGQPITLMSADTYTSPTYLWNTGSVNSTISPTASGAYWLQVTVGGCKGADTVDVTFKPTPEVNLGNDTAICSGVSITLGCPEPKGAQYVWNNGSNDSSITVSESGLYILTVSVNGCSQSDSVTVTRDSTLDINLGRDTTLCTGDELTLTVNNPSAVWNGVSKATSFTVDHPGIYWVTIPGQCGSSSDSINVDFHPCDIAFPSAFTPNNDGLNDNIGVLGTLKYYSNFSLAIFNRWGQRIFYTTDIYNTWNGTFNGVPQDTDTYFYLIYYTIEGKRHMMKGDFQLIR